ncbi:MAG: hypothetical protein AAF658_04655 [Myxococcota bacterium]
MKYWRWEAVPSDLGRNGYLTFVPDFGGWNNVRLGLECALVIAVLSRKILVLPPPQPIYLLNKCRHKCVFSLLDLVPALERFSISAEEWTRRIRAPSRIRALASGCEPRKSAQMSCFEYYEFLENFSTFVPDASKQVIREPIDAQHLRSGAMKTHGSTTDEGRLLVPFYAYVKAGAYYKRLVRDTIRHSERVTCAAAQIIQALGEFSSAHIRRGDFQFHPITPQQFLELVDRVRRPSETLYVATDSNETFPGYVKTLADFPLDLNVNEYGLVDVLVAAHGRTFTGTWFSTFTGHIQRIRGYAGYPDNSTYFAPASRWAAAQAFEKPRSPWYMREWPEAWRDIDDDTADGTRPRPGELTFDVNVHPSIATTGYDLSMAFVAS